MKETGVKDRKKITDALRHMLITKVIRPGVYGAEEVSIDWGTNHARYIDFMTFDPKNTTSVAGLEKGVFTCYEIKSCYEDLYSGRGLNFLGEKNYLVTTMETYIKMMPDLGTGKLQDHIRQTNPDSFWKCNNSYSQIGIIVPVPSLQKEEDEFQCPTPFPSDADWNMKTIIPGHLCDRRRSITEMLFYMMRSRRR